eukprot:gene2863-5627_t
MEILNLAITEEVSTVSPTALLDEAKYRSIKAFVPQSNLGISGNLNPHARAFIPEQESKYTSKKESTKPQTYVNVKNHTDDISRKIILRSNSNKPGSSDRKKHGNQSRITSKTNSCEPKISVNNICNELKPDNVSVVVVGIENDCKQLPNNNKNKHDARRNDRNNVFNENHRNCHNYLHPRHHHGKESLDTIMTANQDLLHCPDRRPRLPRTKPKRDYESTTVIDTVTTTVTATVTDTVTATVIAQQVLLAEKSNSKSPFDSRDFPSLSTRGCLPPRHADVDVVHRDGNENENRDAGSGSGGSIGDRDGTCSGNSSMHQMTVTTFRDVARMSVLPEQSDTGGDGMSHIVVDELRPGWIALTPQSQSQSPSPHTSTTTKHVTNTNSTGITSTTRRGVYNSVNDDRYPPSLSNNCNNKNINNMNNNNINLETSSSVNLEKNSSPSPAPGPGVRCLLPGNIRVTSDKSASQRWNNRWMAVAMAYTANKNKSSTSQSFSSTTITSTDATSTTSMDRGIQGRGGGVMWHSILAPPKPYNTPITLSLPHSLGSMETVGDVSDDTNTTMKAVIGKVGEKHESFDSESTSDGQDDEDNYKEVGKSDHHSTDMSVAYQRGQPVVHSNHQLQGRNIPNDIILSDESFRVTVIAAAQENDIDQLKHLHSLNISRSRDVAAACNDDIWVEVLHILTSHMTDMTGIIWLLDTVRVDVDGKDNRKRTPFLMACEGGHLECAKLLMQRGASLEARDKAAEGPLHKAVRSGSKLMVAWLCDKKRLTSRQLNNRNKRRETSLMIAAMTAHRDVIVQLIAAGADPSCKNTDGLDAACLAALRGDARVLEAILLCNNNSTIKVSLAPMQQVAAVRHNSSRFPSRNSASSIEHSIETTALHQAATAGHIACVRTLLLKGSLRDLAVLDSPHGLTPLMRACEHGHGAAVLELLYLYPYPALSHEDCSQRTIPLCASAIDSLQLEDRKGWTALVHAAKGSSPMECVQHLLLAYPEGVRHVNRIGESILEVIVRRDKPTPSAVAQDKDKDCDGNENVKQLTEEMLMAIVLILRSGAPVTDRFLQRLGGSSGVVSLSELERIACRQSPPTLSVSASNPYPCPRPRLPWNDASNSNGNGTANDNDNFDSIYSDVRIFLADGVLDVHQFVLSTSSPVLQAMLSSDMVDIEEDTGCLLLRFAHQFIGPYSIMVKWMYNGFDPTAELTLNELIDILLLANEFLVDRLQRICEHRIVHDHLIAANHKILTELCSLLPLDQLQNCLVTTIPTTTTSTTSGSISVCDSVFRSNELAKRTTDGRFCFYGPDVGLYNQWIDEGTIFASIVNRFLPSVIVPQTFVRMMHERNRRNKVDFLWLLTDGIRYTMSPTDNNDPQLQTVSPSSSVSLASSLSTTSFELVSELQTLVLREPMLLLTTTGSKGCPQGDDEYDIALHDLWHLRYRVQLFVETDYSDVILVTRDGCRNKTHKAMIAAHSPKLAAMIRFNEDQCNHHMKLGEENRKTTFRTSDGVIKKSTPCMVLHVDGVSGSVLRDLLWFMYTGFVRLNNISDQVPLATEKEEEVEVVVTEGDYTAADTDIDNDTDTDTDRLLRLLWAADEYIMDDLKDHCGALLASNHHEDSVAVIFMTAVVLDMRPLARLCAVRIIHNSAMHEEDVCMRAIMYMSSSQDFDLG